MKVLTVYAHTNPKSFCQCDQIETARVDNTPR
jgi:hypothetical protein